MSLTAKEFKHLNDTERWGLKDGTQELIFLVTNSKIISCYIELGQVGYSSPEIETQALQ